MGFRVQRKVYRLVFQGTDLDGLEVTARSLSTAQFLDLESARLTRAAGGEQSKGATARMLELFASALVEWNAEDEDGQPLPPTLDSVHAQDLDFNMQIIEAWTNAIHGVSAPLPQTSSDGPPSLEASMPMDVLSPSLVS